MMAIKSVRENIPCMLIFEIPGFCIQSCVADQQKFEPNSTTPQNLYLKKARLKHKPIL
jgi:hypothetical protein